MMEMSEAPIIKTKIKVKPEGRPDTFIVTDIKSLEKYIHSLHLDKIHNFVQTSFGLMGCDYTIGSALQVVNTAKTVAVFTNHTQNVGHSLACITDKQLEMFDIGEINLEDLEING
jgi:hypothetical protein